MKRQGNDQQSKRKEPEVRRTKGSAERAKGVIPDAPSQRMAGVSRRFLGSLGTRQAQRFGLLKIPVMQKPELQVSPKDVFFRMSLSK